MWQQPSAQRWLGGQLDCQRDCGVAGGSRSRPPYGMVNEIIIISKRFPKHSYCFCKQDWDASMKFPTRLQVSFLDLECGLNAIKPQVDELYPHRPDSAGCFFVLLVHEEGIGSHSAHQSGKFPLGISVSLRGPRTPRVIPSLSAWRILYFRFRINLYLRSFSVSKFELIDI